MDNLKIYTINNPVYSSKIDIYNKNENDTYIDILYKLLNQYIRDINLLINNQPNSITEKYLVLLSRLHYLSFSIKDLWDKNVKEYGMYRVLFKDLQTLKFGFFELSDLLFAALNPLFDIRDKHYQLYQIIDELIKYNSTSEEEFNKILQTDSEIIDN